MTSIAEFVVAKATAEVALELAEKLARQCSSVKVDFRVDSELKAHSEFAAAHLKNVLTELEGVLSRWPVIPLEKGVS